MLESARKGHWKPDAAVLREIAELYAQLTITHGATTGRLDPDMLFYMLSRGLDRNAAQSLLVFAFLADALTDMSLPAVRSAVESQLIAQLPDSQLLRQFR